MIRCHKITRLSFNAVIFAAETVWLWSISPAGDMGGEIREPITSNFDVSEEYMTNRKPLVGDRIRKIDGSFAWIGHRFLHGGYFTSLGHHELLLYFFLVLVADRQGLSYYHYDKICSLLGISLDDYIIARNLLIDKDLVAFDGTFFQVLSLPRSPVLEPVKVLQGQDDMKTFDRATIEQIMNKQLNLDHES